MDGAVLAGYPAYDSYRDSGVEWIGAVPEAWEVKALRRFINVQSGEMIAKEAETPEGYPIYGGNGIRGFTSQFNTKAPMILIGRVGAHCGNVHVVRENVWASEHAYRAFPRSDFDIDFLAYTIASLNLNRFAIRTAQPLLNSEIVHSQPAPAPPLLEQRAIAGFLDEKCAKVDEAVRIKQAQIALLRERRQILIQQAVTTGLNPSAPMKDSGIDWIGQIPAHWEVIPLKRLFRERNDRSTTGAETLLSLRMNEGLIPHDDVSDKAIGADALKDYKQVFPGQLVMNRMRASIGIFGIVISSGIVSPDYAIFDIATPANGDFFLQLFKTGVMGQQFRNASRGLGTGSSGFMRLYTDDFGAISVALPPLAEQIAIVSHINCLSEQIDNGITIKDSQIAALREYRTSLINAAVTGKIKVA